MWKKLSYIQQNLIWTIPATMFAGLLFGYFSNDVSNLKLLIMPFTFLMVYPMMVNLQIKKVFAGGDTKVQIATQIINFGIIPFFAFGLGKLFFPNSPMLEVGLLLAALLPTSGMTISWTGFARGNMLAAVKMTVIGLVLGSLLTPIFIKFLMGTVVDIPLVSIFKQIVLIVFLPMLLGYITQQLIIKKYGDAKYHKDIKQKFPMISTIGVLAIIFVAMSLKAKGILAKPELLIGYFIPLFLLYAFNFLISTIIGKMFFNRGDAIALVYGTVMRNLSISLAIAMTVFGKDGSEIALIIAMAFVIQSQSAAWYVKFTDKIFGKPDDGQPISNVVEEGLFSLTSSDTIQDAINLLEEEHIHNIAIVDNKNHPIGIITEHMILNLIEEKTTLETKLEKVKLKSIVTCEKTTPIEKALKSMQNKHKHRIIILNEKGEAESILTGSDILKLLTFN